MLKLWAFSDSIELLFACLFCALMNEIAFTGIFCTGRLPAFADDIRLLLTTCPYDWNLSPPLIKGRSFWGYEGDPMPCDDPGGFWYLMLGETWWNGDFYSSTPWRLYPGIGALGLLCLLSWGGSVTLAELGRLRAAAFAWNLGVPLTKFLRRSPGRFLLLDSG